MTINKLIKIIYVTASPTIIITTDAFKTLTFHKVVR